MKEIGIYGASGFGREILPVVRSQVGSDVVLTFIDDQPGATSVNGHAVYPYEAWKQATGPERAVVIAVADGRARARLAQRCAADGLAFFSVRAPNVVVMDDVAIGEGAVLAPFVTITSNVRIGRQFHANLYSYVAHDCVIGDFVTFAPAVRCNGNVVIEEHAYIGTGAVLRQGAPGAPLVIGAGAVVGMGAVVTRSVAPGTTVVGNPARPMAAR